MGRPYGRLLALPSPTVCIDVNTYHIAGMGEALPPVGDKCEDSVWHRTVFLYRTVYIHGRLPVGWVLLVGW